LRKVGQKINYWWEKERNVMIVFMLIPPAMSIIGYVLTMYFGSNRTIFFLGAVLLFSGISSLGITIILGLYLGLSRLVFAPWWIREGKSKITEWAVDVRKTAEKLDQERAKYSRKAALEFMEKVQKKLREEKQK